MRSDGLSGSRPRKAAMRKCSIIGCLLLLLLSNCSTATDLGGDTYRRICTLPDRHAHGGRLWLPRCGSGRGRNGQSYSINIFGLSTSCPLPPSNAQGYAVRRHDDAVLRGAVGAEDDRARVVIHNSIIILQSQLAHDCTYALVRV